jgi:hypothetical protein
MREGTVVVHEGTERCIGGMEWCIRGQMGSALNWAIVTTVIFASPFTCNYNMLCITQIATGGYVTVQCLKEKVDSRQAVINYLMHLKTRGQNPKGIQIDRRKEFVNKKLEKWCSEHRIEIRLTALYSPSQNGVAEHTNRTLVELSHAMITGNHLPEFLWEYTVLHAAYICN